MNAISYQGTGDRWVFRPIAFVDNMFVRHAELVTALVGKIWDCINVLQLESYNNYTKSAASRDKWPLMEITTTASILK